MPGHALSITSWYHGWNSRQTLCHLLEPVINFSALVSLYYGTQTFSERCE